MHILEYSIHSYVKDINMHFKNHLGSFEVQKLATRAFKAVEKYHYGKVKKYILKLIKMICLLRRKVENY